jgi:hypothetical protein
MPTTHDIWEYAANQVDNKNVLFRVAHAPRFDSVRSAINSRGSLGSKVLKFGGSIARAGLGLIPIPALGSFLSAIEGQVEGLLRKAHHKQKAKAGGVGSNDYVKFSLKEVTLEDMDRYRRKVEESVHEANTALNKFNQAPSFGISNTCDRYTEVALKIAQAERRLRIFDEQALQVLTLMQACSDWSRQFHQSVSKVKLEVSEELNDLVKMEMEERRKAALQGIATFGKGPQLNATLAVQTTTADLDAMHSGCGEFCTTRNNALKSTNVHLERFITGVKFATDPITAEGALSYTRSSFAVANEQSYIDAFKGG